MDLPDDSPTVDSLLELLGSDRARIREMAREQLVAFGSRAVPRLRALLQQPDEHVRWESAKALGGISGPEVSAALTMVLDDPNRDVRWVAADGLAQAGDDAIEPILHELIGRSGNVWVREAGLRVLEGVLHEHNSSYLRPVLDALHDAVPVFGVPIAAYEALVAHHRHHVGLDRHRKHAV
jgi:HEAT repeat protein